MNEPILRLEDLKAWETWRRTALVHARTDGHRRRVRVAIDVATAAFEETGGSIALMWSGGKDSTAMVHLVCAESGLSVVAVSEKDDLDYPGEDDYIERLASKWGLDLRIVRPPGSLIEWLENHSTELEAGEDVHGRSAALSKENFYDVIEAATEPFDGIFLGLRKGESHGRLMNRVTHGHTYRRRDGKLVCQPLADWSGLDVMAYMAARDIEPLPVYRCVGFDPTHTAEPWRVRKSWWLPGAGARYGATAWLKHYYPSLYRKLETVIRGSSRFV